MTTEEALAKWLNIMKAEVQNYYIVHRCRPLPLAKLLELLKQDETSFDFKDNEKCGDTEAQKS